MPLRRRYPARRAIRRKPYSRTRARPRRSYAAKRRSYTRRPRTRKAILNLTSRKKQDVLVNTSNITSQTPTGSSTFNTSPAVLNADNIYIIPWVSTARPALLNGALAPPIADATRTSTSCYMRGLKETITIATNSGAPWMWRRICFTLKGDDLTAYVGSNFTWWRATATQGITRNLTSIYAHIPALNAFRDLVFDGQEGFDWADAFTAKLDTKRIGVKYDKTITLNAGNSNGQIRSMQRWHTMNHNLEYSDEEQGGILTTGPYSVSSKVGMGDYYVVDMFRGVGTATDTLSFGVQSKIYWHEK
ncbi:capsid protein [Tortoise genomovirus 9]|uniref:Capsid protein n=1 Tax=Tortoise genomovirus 9 TaxID=2582892 RepID=A0A4P8W7M4_9VIRU|nr:capsid protein [Tortoise genomovirus 9]QCS37563.1 capsid protein [Tortoise genomovirus 9]